MSIYSYVVEFTKSLYDFCKVKNEYFVSEKGQNVYKPFKSMVDLIGLLCVDSSKVNESTIEQYTELFASDVTFTQLTKDVPAIEVDHAAADIIRLPNKVITKPGIHEVNGKKVVLLDTSCAALNLQDRLIDALDLDINYKFKTQTNDDDVSLRNFLDSVINWEKPNGITIITGSKTQQKSLILGLKLLPPDASIIFFPSIDTSCVPLGLLIKDHEESYLPSIIFIVKKDVNLHDPIFRLLVDEARKKYTQVALLCKDVKAEDVPEDLNANIIRLEKSAVLFTQKVYEDIIAKTKSTEAEQFILAMQEIEKDELADKEMKPEIVESFWKILATPNIDAELVLPAFFKKLWSPLFKEKKSE